MCERFGLVMFFVMAQEKVHPTRTHKACSAVCGAHDYILRTFSSTSNLDMLKLHCQESAAAQYQRKRARPNEPKHAALSHIRSAMRRSLPPAATVADITRLEATAAAEKNVAGQKCMKSHYSVLSTLFAEPQ
jgi:hypothetical protein